MDTSEEYVKMCDSSEIQEHTRANPGDVHLCRNGDESGASGFVWLPRQDQIQDMLQPIELHELLDMCGNGSGIMWEALHEYADSFEQLWLAFYMHEKHKKVWDGKKWVA